MTAASRKLLLLLLLLSCGALAGSSAVSTSAALAASTINPGNTLASATSTWFGLTATGATLCAGVNATLDCPFGSRPAVGTTVATATLTVKATSTYVLSVANGTGPAGIATIVRATFGSTGAAIASLAMGGADTLNVTLKVKGNTPVGAYTGTVVVTDQITGIIASFPISVTH
jgi:hypothetical protein